MSIMALMDFKYLSDDKLRGFENYRYSAVDTNPISVYVMHPFWNYVVQFCPRWLAPNLMTFTGFLLTVLNFVLLGYFDYDFNASNGLRIDVAPIPRWVWLFCAITHFLAYTLDGIDGKQARRTGASSPIGELFDHGLDSWTTVFVPCSLYEMFGRDDHSVSVLEFYVCLWIVQFTFLLSHWEKYNTGILYLPWGYDVSEIVHVQLLKICFLLFVITFFEDYVFWKFNLPVLDVPAGYTLKYFLFIGSLGISLPMSVYNIFTSYVNRTGKMRGFWEANRPLVGTFIFMIICAVWVTRSPNDVFHLDPRCFYLMTGTIVSNICCRLIVSQMSNTRCELLNWLLLPVSMAAAISMYTTRGAPATELLILRLLTSSILMAHVHYGICVVRQMCAHFDIDCFRLKHRQED